MKKFAWIIALLAALSLGFFACTEPDGNAYGPPRVAVVETELTTLFDMQDASNGTITHGIQELPVGALTFPASGAGPTAPLVKAGDMPGHISSFEVVEVGGKKALKYVTVANWGPGFDMPHSAFGFRAGDVITIIGTAAGTSIDLALNVNQGGAQHITGNRITSAGAFTITAELTAANIAEILTNEQVVIRFEDRVGGTTVTVTQVKVEGQRPSSITQLGAPTIALSGDTLSWTAIPEANGYKVYAGTELLATTSSVSVNLYTLFGDKDKAAGTYSITVVTGGTVGSTSDSLASNAVNYTYEPYSVEMEFPRDLTAIVTHTNPRFVKFGGWGTSGITIAPYNKVTIPAQQQANFAYVYPTDIAGFNIAEWDFVTLSLRTTGTYSAFGYKKYPSDGIDATGRTGSLSSNSSLGSGDTIVVEIRKNPEGLGFQKYSANADAFVVEIDSAVYSKAERFNVSLDANGGAVTPARTFLVDGTTVADHLPTPTRAGYIFLGWQLSGTYINATTVVGSGFSGATLEAQWKVAQTLAPLTVAFDDDPATGNLKSFVNPDPGNRDIVVNVVGNGTGYSFATTNNGYGNVYAYFTVPFPAGADFSDYNKVTFKYKGVSGDVGSKSLHMVVNEADSFGYIGFNVDTPYITSASVTGTDETTITLTINQGLASAFDGQNIGFAFGIHAGDYSIQISDVVFSQN